MEKSVEDIDVAELEEIFKTDDLPSCSSKSFEDHLSECFSEEREEYKIFKKNSRRKSHPFNPAAHSQSKESSLIHKGDTDSSDDEDNRYFLEQKYNECGRNIRNLLQDQEKSDASVFFGNGHKSANGSSWKKAASTVLTDVGSGSEKKTKDVKVKSDVYMDPVFYIRIIKPQISSALIAERMVGRTAVSMTKIKSFTETEDLKMKDWVTGGVVIGKCVKTSQKGNQYCLWTITDLHGDIKTISVFLFGSACKSLWKTPLGTVVGILNPTVLDKKDNSKHLVTLSVDNTDKVMVFGTSKDYGTCQSKTKSGEMCINVVNVSKCAYCVYHVKQEYKKASTRLELQSACSGRGLDDLRNKILGKNEVFYAGKSFSSIPSKKSSRHVEKDDNILKKLSAQPLRSNPDKCKTQIDKDSSIINRLNSPGGLLKKSTPVTNKTPVETKRVLSALPTLNIPVLKPGGSSPMIDLNVPLSKKKLNLAKLSAINYIKENGLKNPEQKKNKSPEQRAALKRKIEAEINQESKRLKTDEKTPKKDGQALLKEKLERSGITDRFLELMKSGTSNKELEKVVETEQMEKYYHKLEIKEQMEEKMLSTFKVECKAVRCLKCNYKSFSASDLCKKENHPLKVVNAVKRFWKCGDCSQRTVCLELIPLHTCKTCGGSKWEKTSMMREKKDNNVVRPTLSIRGHEESVIGGAVKGDLNLLVPV